MRGHITKRGKGSYSIVIELEKDLLTGRRNQQWLTVKGTKKEAEKRLSELMHQLDNGIFIKPSKTTLLEYLERWLKDYVNINLAPRTAEGYQLIMHRHIIPTLGSKYLTQLKPEHLQNYYSDKLATGLSAQTVRHHHTALHKALQTAVEWGLLTRNVADAVKSPKPKCTEMKIWNEYELTTFIEQAKGSPYYALFYTALFTGMRRSELLALKWGNVDLMLCQIHVCRSMHVLIGGEIIFSAPKTAKGKRMISLSPSATSVLREHREQQQLERLGTPITDENFVFCNIDGKPLLSNTITHAWSKLIKRLGLKPIRLHDARHTHASLMLKQGAHPKIVQERLGHSGIQITLDTYSHVAPGLQEAAAQRFDDVLSTKYNG
ncbi:MAG: site-specific integrase [Dehalococcoidales bacterium]|nr:site-specific integrase [Dehalococcoidales bacterium]